LIQALALVLIPSIFPCALITIVAKLALTIAFALAIVFTLTPSKPIIAAARIWWKRQADCHALVPQPAGELTTKCVPLIVALNQQ
jgi:hypothetical protein